MQFNPCPCILLWGWYTCQPTWRLSCCLITCKVDTINWVRGTENYTCEQKKTKTGQDSRHIWSNATGSSGAIILAGPKKRQISQSCLSCAFFLSSHMPLQSSSLQCLWSALLNCKWVSFRFNVTNKKCLAVTKDRWRMGGSVESSWLCWLKALRSDFTMPAGLSLDVHLQFGTCHLVKTFEAPMRRFCLFFL